MQYYEENERSGKRAGTLAAILYFVVCVTLMFVIRFDFEVNRAGEGILIDFGDVDSAGGTATVVQNTEERQVRQTRPQQLRPEDMMTQDYEDAPVVEQRHTPPQETATETPQTAETTTPPTPPQPEQQVDRRALFPGAANDAQSDSRGTEEGSGHQGSAAGMTDGNPSGSGLGNNSDGFSLSGRSLVGALPAPRYGPNKSGKVIVEITVDSRGNVTRAIPAAKGSTTNDSELIKAAIDAAGKARFNTVNGDGLQAGTITYFFILQ